MKVGEGAWCWFNEPRALTTRDVTITGWVGRTGDIRVASYNNDTGALVTRTLHARLQYDDHANPSFYLRRDGRVTAFYSRHAGAPLYHRTTTHPARVSSWGPETTVPTNTPGHYGYTYPNPVWSPPESRLYLFWRGGNFLPTYSTSDDEGETWAPARTLMDDNEPESSQRPYVKYASRDGVLHLAYNQAHPRNRRTSVFYVKYTPGVGWERANGTDIGAPPFIPTDGDRVFNAWEHDMRSWVHDVAVGADGHPRIVFATFSRRTSYTDHRYWYARWDGRRWRKRQLTRAGPSIDPDGEIMYSAGLVLDHEHPEIVYLARKRGRWFQIEVWKTGDGGHTWSVRPVTGAANHHMRPVVPRNHTSTPGTQVLFMTGRYNSYTTYQTDVALAHRPLD
jgi:BNR repeat-containing family member